VMFVSCRPAVGDEADLPVGSIAMMKYLVLFVRVPFEETS